MLIGLSFSKPIKSNPSLFNTLSCFKEFSMCKHFSLKNVQCSDFNFLTLNKKHEDPHMF